MGSVFLSSARASFQARCTTHETLRSSLTASSSISFNISTGKDKHCLFACARAGRGSVPFDPLGRGVENDSLGRGERASLGIALVWQHVCLEGADPSRPAVLISLRVPPDRGPTETPSGAASADPPERIAPFRPYRGSLRDGT
jgi:hypothetical protein